MIAAKIIKHSSFEGNELISIETKAPKFLDGEIEKHCMVASNSSSSRAIPLKKTLVQKPYLPNDIRKNEKGMQGFEGYSQKELVDIKMSLLEIYDKTTENVAYLDKNFSIHKQHLNRYLEPFMMQTKIMTATKEEWDYFLSLRYHKDADPNIYALASEIKHALLKSRPTELKEYEWHLPYVNTPMCQDYALQISVARCARTSYKLHDGKEPTIEEDVKLYKRLTEAKPQHLSPLDHQAKPIGSKIANASKYIMPRHWPQGVTRINRDLTFGSGKFNSWIQYRHYYLQEQMHGRD
jgi:thymidylate synthase ThyX